MNCFSLISAILWGLSSAAWIWAIFVKAPIEKAEFGEEGTIVANDGSNGERAGLSIGGMFNPSFEKFNTYFVTSAKRNAIAAVISAAAALFQMLALVFP